MPANPPKFPNVAGSLMAGEMTVWVELRERQTQNSKSKEFLTVQDALAWTSSHCGPGYIAEVRAAWLNYIPVESQVAQAEARGPGLHVVPGGHTLRVEWECFDGEWDEV